MAGAYLRYHTSFSGEVLTKRFTANELNGELFDVELVPQGNTFALRIKLLGELVIELLAISFHISKQGAVQCLNKQYQLQHLQGEIHNNDLTPLHIQYQYEGQHYLISNTHGWFSWSAKDEGDQINFTIYPDAAAMHPAWSHRESQRKPDAVAMQNRDHEYALSFACNEIDLALAPPILSRYPFGAEAGFIITDHCDYDQADTLRTFLDAWLGKGLKMTKGVFALKSNYAKDGLAATLEDEDYHRLINELYNDGSEIAPHALNQSGQISKKQFDAALDSISKAYNCRTWIDHGSYQKYTYSVGGSGNEYQLSKRLKDLGYTSLWSYYDAAIDPTRSLNIFAATHTSYKQFTKHLLRGNFATAGHYLKTVLEQRAQTSGRRSTMSKLMGAVRKNLVAKKSIGGLVKDIGKVFRYSAAQALPYTEEELNYFSPVLHTELKQPLYTREAHELVLFATQEVVHTQDAYTETALEQMIAERGLHIGHTYLLNKLPYLNGVFDKGSNELSEGWITFVESLSGQVKAGNIWNPTMQEFVGYMLQLQSLRVTHLSPRSMLIENKRNKDIVGLSFMAGSNVLIGLAWGSVQPQYKQTSNGQILFWGNIPAGNSITVSW
ncbi:MAG: hypothetical protein EOP51_12410 [Sphingobacteriales bacterium]|nr:MAG: hypothetical protein EOP51_12410 [Sphingobacteriales bacterium]